MKNILVPIDFTPASRVASEYAASLAQLFNAKIYLFHVYIEPTPATEVPSAWIITDDRLQKESEAHVNSEVEYLSNAYAIDVSGVSEMGYKSDAIIEKAKEVNADLIVMGRKEGKSKILGSTTLTINRRSKRPVLIIPAGHTFHPIKNIVFASDFAEMHDNKCLVPLFDLLEHFKSNLQLLHVKKKGKAMTAQEVPGRIQIGRAFAQVPFWGYDEVEDDNVEHAIENYIQKHPTDLLVMVAHHHNIIERLFGTVHTQSMGYRAKLPLLILEDKE